MELGPKLGEGATADVYAWGEGRIVKLYRPEFKASAARHEERVTRIAFEAGAPAPRSHGVVEIDGRIGIVMSRCDGDTLFAHVASRRLTPQEMGAIGARLHHAIHALPYPSPIWTFRSWALASIELLREQRVPDDVLERVTEVLMTLPEGGVLCHGDLHPGNILVTATGPVAIDWTSAVQGDPLMDIARQHLTFAMIPADPRWEASRRAADESFLATYAELTATTVPALLLAVAPYLLVMAAMRMLEATASDRERQFLMAHIRSTDLER